MKKIIKILLVVTLFTVSVFALCILGADTAKNSGAEKSQNIMQAQNVPYPPNPDDLDMLGIEPFKSTLPVVLIDTENQQIVKEEKRFVKVAILDDASDVNDIYSPTAMVLDAKIKERGASSYLFDKSQYRLEFYNESRKKPLDYDFLGLGEHSDWVLNGPFLDRSLMRNYLMYKLSGEIMEWAPDCRFLELFVDGSYQGVYLAIEPVEAGASRLRLSPFGLVSGATAYIVDRERVGTEEAVIMTYGNIAGYTGNELSVQYPKGKKLTEQQKNWIENDISRFEKALYGDKFADPVVGYAQYIDIDSFVDFYILNEFAMNYDAGYLSTFAYKELNGKLKMCVWDFNNSFDNYVPNKMNVDQFYVKNSYWFDRLLQDRAFVDKVVERYRQLRENSLSNVHIDAVLNEAQETMGEAIDRNFAHWGYTFDSNMLISAGDPDRNPHSYEEAVQMLKDTITGRLNFMDESIEQLYSDCVN